MPYPLILVEGGEKAGKSWSAAELALSPKVGPTLWLDLGEGSADEYGKIPGAPEAPDAPYEILEHDGTFGVILSKIREAHEYAQKVADADLPPVVLVIDSMTREWDLLKELADREARQRLARKNRAPRPDQEVKIDMDLWNTANARHSKIMNLLMTFPGIAIMTARGKEVVAMDENGRPIPGQRAYKVEGQKNLAYDASVWLRYSREHAPLVIGARSVHAGIRPGVDQPVPSKDLTLEKVIFDILKCDPGTAQPRDLVQPNPDMGPPESKRALELAFEIAGAGTEDEVLQALWKAVTAATEGDEITIGEMETLRGSIRARVKAAAQ